MRSDSLNTVVCNIIIQVISRHRYPSHYTTMISGESRYSILGGGPKNMWP